METRLYWIRFLKWVDGDVAVGLQRAFDLGFMDSPLASNVHILEKF